MAQNNYAGIFFVMFCLVVSIFAISLAKQDRDARLQKEMLNNAAQLQMTQRVTALEKSPKVIIEEKDLSDEQVNNIINQLNQLVIDLLPDDPYSSNAYCVAQQQNNLTVFKCKEN